MRALLLAAGRGERMRPLSDTVAKPLLRAGGRALIAWQIEALVRARVTELVINVAHLAEQIEAELGDGSRYGARIVYSREGSRAEDALETRGGIVKALPLLGPAPFIVASSDLLTDFDYATLDEAARLIDDGRLDAHLVLVDNPSYHPRGDMGMQALPGGALATLEPPRLTYANVGVLAPRLFAGLAAERAPLFPWLFESVARGRVGAQHWRGRWANVGTPRDLALADKMWR